MAQANVDINAAFVTRLHAVNIDKGRAYCGPSAIAAISGLHPKGEIRSVINRIRGRDENSGVCGLHNRELLSACWVLGYELLPVYWWPDDLQGPMRIDWKSPPTLRQFVVRMKSERAMIVNVTGHYVSCARRLVIDSLVPDGDDVEDHRCSRRKVKKAWLVKRRSK